MMLILELLRECWKLFKYCLQGCDKDSNESDEESGVEDRTESVGRETDVTNVGPNRAYAVPAPSYAGSVFADLPNHNTRQLSASRSLIKTGAIGPNRASHSPTIHAGLSSVTTGQPYKNTCGLSGTNILPMTTDFTTIWPNQGSVVPEGLPKEVVAAHRLAIQKSSVH